MRFKQNYAWLVLTVTVLACALGVSLLSHPASAMRLLQATGTVTTTPSGTSTSVPISTTPSGTATGVPLAASPVYGSPFQNLPHRTISAIQANGGYSFKPSVLRIKAGTVVTWRNTGLRALKLVSTNARWIFHPQVRPGKSTEYLFTKAGSYRYRTAGHHHVFGKILVRS